MSGVVFLIALLGCGSSPSTAPGPTATPAPTKSPDPEPAPKPPEPEPPLPDADATRALADAACPRVVRPFFYRIEKDGKVSHALGTRHMSVGLAKMPPTVKAELAKAKLVMFETPPGDEDDGDVPEDPTPLPDQLGAARWAKLQRLVGSQTAAALEHADAATAMVALITVYENTREMLDSEIEEFVTDENIATGGFETSAFQARLLHELLDLRMLRATLDGTPDRTTLRHDAVEDLAEFCAGTDEVPGLDDHTRELLQKAGYTTAELQTIDDKLLDQRNRSWMPKLEELFGKRGDVFVVVGADHLVGPRGVIAMLAQRGFKTTRLK